MALLLFVIGVLGYWEPTMSLLAIVTSAVIISLVLGLPAGIVLARSDLLEKLLRPVLEFTHRTPGFIFLVVALVFFGAGKAPALVAAVVYAAPPVIRLTSSGIRQSPADIVEAAQALGSTRWQMLLEVQWPVAIPSVLAGINQTAMLALNMAVIASLIGAGGLGQELLQSIQDAEPGKAIVTGLVILALAFALDRLTRHLATRRRSAIKSPAAVSTI